MSILPAIPRHLKRVALAAMAAALAACGDPAIFDRVAAPESADVAAAPYPRLADTPAPAPAGRPDAATPDPAAGAALQIDLAAEAAEAERRRAALAGPVR